MTECLLAVGLGLGALAADGLTGLVHWACDRWGDERTRWLGPTLIYAFREHHRDPTAMLAHGWRTTNREPLLAAGAAIALLALPSVRALLAGHALLQGFLLAFVLYGTAANQLHFWAHAERVPRVVRGLQRWRLILSPEAHALHHQAPFTRSYCIATGWLNPILDASGFWQGLERGILRIARRRERTSVAARR